MGHWSIVGAVTAIFGLIGYSRLPAQSALRWLPNTLFGLRQYSVMGYDAARGRIVSYGGHREYDGDRPAARGDTWEWDGAAWLRMAPQSSPAALWGVAMAYDSTRRRTVLFGGGHFWPVPIAETWEWDGLDWQRRQPSRSPPALSWAAMSYDSARNRMVLVGGVPNTRVWEWDGDQWFDRGLAPIPADTELPAMAYDEVRRRTVLFGGMSGTTARDQVFEWDGSQWFRPQSATRPSARHDAALYYDPLRQRVRLHGGSGRNDTWEWDGLDWSFVATTGGPATGNVSAAFDVQRGCLVLQVDGETWELEDRVWQLRRAALVPSTRFGAAAATDGNGGGVVLFGGRTGDRRLLADTWQWNDQGWQRLSHPSAPTARASAAMTFDIARGQLVMFGGTTSSQEPSNETWLYGNGQWTAPILAVRPPGRAAAAFVYDRARLRGVLFGGNASSVLGDTWLWDGRSWTEVRPPNIPPARYAAAMTYDESRQRVMLYGGIDAQPRILTDTWEWDGATWQLLRPASAPTAEVLSMVYDRSRGQVVLLTLGEQDGQSWVWNGSDWVASARMNVSRDALAAPLAIDGRGAAVAMLAGDGLESWRLTGAPTPQLRDLAPGCSVARCSAGLAVGRPFVGNLSWQLDLVQASARRSCLFALATGVGTRVFGPCRLHLAEPLVLLPASTGDAGFASVRLSIPLHLALPRDVYVQAVVIDPDNGCGGLSFTAAVEVTFGI